MQALTQCASHSEVSTIKLTLGDRVVPVVTRQATFKLIWAWESELWHDRGITNRQMFWKYGSRRVLSQVGEEIGVTMI